MMLDSFIYFTDKNLLTLATLKIHTMVYSTLPLTQRRKTSEHKTLSSHKNDAQSVADGVCRLVTICLYPFDVSRPRSENQ